MFMLSQFTGILLWVVIIVVISRVGKKNNAMRSSGARAGLDLDDNLQARLRGMFTSTKERLIAVLGNNTIQNFLINGTLSDGFAVLSDKRIYFRGRSFSKNGRHYYRRTEERIVDLKDVTGTGFVYFNSIWMIVCCVFALVILFIGIIVAAVNSNVRGDDFGQFVGVVIIVIGLIIAVFFFILYRLKKLTLFEISFAGGGIAFDTTWLNNIIAFVCLNGFAV